MALRYYTGTITGHGQDKEVTAIKLRKAMKGFGTDEKIIIEVLSTHTNHELQEIKDYYKTCYGRILGEDIESELCGHFETLCLYLLLPRHYFRAYCLHHAMHGLGTNETSLIEILCTSNNAEIAVIKEAYTERFGKDLVKDLQDDTSGDLQHILVSITQGNRSEEQVIDQDLVKQDVHDLRKAGVKKVGTEESVFNRILACRSIPHLQAVFDAYTIKDQQDIIAVIRSETSGSLMEAYLAIARYVTDPLDYFAECFYQSMKGAGTDDERLMQLVVNHCEIDLKDIATTYLEKYHVGLSRAIHDDTSGDYRKLLIRLTNLPAVQPPADQLIENNSDQTQQSL